MSTVVDLHGRHLLRLADYSPEEIRYLIDLRNGNGMEVHFARSEPWRITLVETGANTMTGGRLAAIRQHLDPDEPFCFTYGDGVADIDIADLVRFHKTHGLRATVTSVAPPGRFGARPRPASALDPGKEGRAPVHAGGRRPPRPGHSVKSDSGTALAIVR